MALSPFLLGRSPLSLVAALVTICSSPAVWGWRWAGAESAAAGPGGQDLALPPRRQLDPGTFLTLSHAEKRDRTRELPVAPLRGAVLLGEASVMLGQERRGQLTGAASQRWPSRDNVGCH